MNFTETFSEFSSRLGPTDLALYAGAALVLWVLFQDKLGGVVGKVKEALSKLVSNTPGLPQVKLPIMGNHDKFFDLVSSWKKTRDLAEEVGCPEAIKVADQMFPFLSPKSCQETKE